ncbi:MAG: hypothetical protein JSS04_04650 [Proteobacteria bacterium]|nr:hypothetical protein [Pseudomonadota bacterium]
MGVREVVVEPTNGRRRNRQSMAGTKRAAALFRMWHGVRDMLNEAEHLGDGELVHFLAVAQMLIEERTAGLTPGTEAFVGIDTSLPN